MEFERKALESFVSVHADRILTNLPSVKERIVILAPYSTQGVPLSVDYEMYDAHGFQNKFNTESRLVQWVLEQMHTYDTERQLIVGLWFSTDTVLTHVIQKT